MGRRSGGKARGRCPADLAAKFRADGWETRGGFWFRPDARYVNYRWHQVQQWWYLGDIPRARRAGWKA